MVTQHKYAWSQRNYARPYFQLPRFIGCLFLVLDTWIILFITILWDGDYSCSYKEEVIKYQDNKKIVWCHLTTQEVDQNSPRDPSQVQRASTSEYTVVLFAPTPPQIPPTCRFKLITGDISTIFTPSPPDCPQPHRHAERKVKVTKMRRNMHFWNSLILRLRGLHSWDKKQTKKQYFHLLILHQWVSCSLVSV